MTENNTTITLEREFYIKGMIEAIKNHLEDESLGFYYTKGFVSAYQQALVYASGTVITTDDFEIFGLTLDIAYHDVNCEVFEYIEQLDIQPGLKQQIKSVYEDISEAKELEEFIEERMNNKPIMI